MLTPRWVLAHLLVIGVGATFVVLGLWQLDRHSERMALNELRRERLAQPPADLQHLLTSAGEEFGAIEYRRATVTGEFAPEEEVLIRSQVHLGTAGFHVVTPLETGVGRGVLVNRGWVPLTLDSVPVELAPPPEGATTVEGWVRLSQERPSGGPQEADGRLVVFNRVNLERIGQQVPLDLAPVYLVMVGERGVLPEVVRTPEFDDNGPHLAYAIQWFGFALVGLVGYFFLCRRAWIQLGRAAARSATTS